MKQQNTQQSLGIRLLIGLIGVYQKTLSPDQGVLKALFPHGICRFQPTCSHYARESLILHGWRGVWPSLVRIGRCHPFSKGGYDPVVYK